MDGTELVAEMCEALKLGCHPSTQVGDQEWENWLEAFWPHGTAAKAPAPRVCPRCGGRLEERRGRFGRFIGCDGYPACRYTESVS